MSNAKILIIKTGLIETLTFPDGSSYESAIRKKPVPMVKVHTLGAEGNDVGLKAITVVSIKPCFYADVSSLL